VGYSFSCLASIAHKRHDRFVFDVYKWLAAHVNQHLLDRAAGECPGALARIIGRNRLAAIPSDAQSLAINREVSGLGFDLR
jgi:hypothetical protein